MQDLGIMAGWPTNRFIGTQQNSFVLMQYLRVNVFRPDGIDARISYVRAKESSHNDDESLIACRPEVADGKIVIP